MSASCSAGASLRPSPVIATTWQRAGLVSADEGRRAEGLDRFETTDQCAACRHLPGTHRQRQADRREQALGYERHRDADGRQKRVGQLHAHQQRDGEEGGSTPTQAAWRDAVSPSSVVRVGPAASNARSLSRTRCLRLRPRMFRGVRSRRPAGWREDFHPSGSMYRLTDRGPDSGAYLPKCDLPRSERPHRLGPIRSRRCCRACHCG